VSFSIIFPPFPRQSNEEQEQQEDEEAALVIFGKLLFCRSEKQADLCSK